MAGTHDERGCRHRRRWCGMLRVEPKRGHADLECAQVQLLGDPRSQHAVYSHTDLRDRRDEMRRWPAAGTCRCIRSRPDAGGRAPGSSIHRERWWPRDVEPAGAGHNRATALRPRSSEPSRAARSNSVSPSRASSLRITWLTAGWVRCSRRRAGKTALLSDGKKGLELRESMAFHLMQAPGFREQASSPFVLGVQLT